MKRLILVLLFVLPLSVRGNDPTVLPNLFDLVLNKIQRIQVDLNGWTHLGIGSKSLWMPHSFYKKVNGSPEAWISQVNQLGFCEPSKTWKDFPVLSVSNNSVSEHFELVAENPNVNVSMQMSYSETVMSGGKTRNVSYNYVQQGAAVGITCAAKNEQGDVHSITQKFDIRNPKRFHVEQKENGKMLSI